MGYDITIVYNDSEQEVIASGLRPMGSTPVVSQNVVYDDITYRIVKITHDYDDYTVVLHVI